MPAAQVELELVYLQLVGARARSAESWPWAIWPHGLNDRAGNVHMKSFYAELEFVCVGGKTIIELVGTRLILPKDALPLASP